MSEQLLESICGLTHAIREATEQRKHEFDFFKSMSQLPTKHDLNHVKDIIMSAISDFAAKQKAFNDRQGAAIDSLVSSVAGVTGDVKTLNDKITELQNSSGGVTPEDQALIDDLETQGDALATKLETVTASLKGLDDATPPSVPSAP